LLACTRAFAAFGTSGSARRAAALGYLPEPRTEEDVRREQSAIDATARCLYTWTPAERAPARRRPRRARRRALGVGEWGNHEGGVLVRKVDLSGRRSASADARRRRPSGATTSAWSRGTRCDRSARARRGRNQGGRF
jgi:hypothetical protein